MTPKRRRRVRPPATFRVQLYNCGAGPTEAKLHDLHAFVAAGVTLILGQEFGDRTFLVARFLEQNPTWRVLWVRGSNAGRKTPILFDSAVLKRAWWAVLWTYVAGVFLGRRGAGPDRSSRKQLNRAKFRHRANGATFKVLNHHLVASAFSTHGDERANRTSMWLQQVRWFFKVAGRIRVPVVGGGDWNAELLNQTFRKEVPVGWVWDRTGHPTHGLREIDLLGHMDDPRLRVLDKGVDETDGSRKRHDHRSPWAVYEIR